jgi:hypothetical protein
MFNLKDKINTRGALTFDEQSSLIAQLKPYLEDPETREDALALLLQLRKRDDLYARMSREIYSLLQTVDTEQVVSALPRDEPPAHEIEIIQSQPDLESPASSEHLQPDEPTMPPDEPTIHTTEVIQSQPDSESPASSEPIQPDEPVMPPDEPTIHVTEVIQSQADSEFPASSELIQPDERVTPPDESPVHEIDDTWTKRMITALRGLTKRNSVE